MAGYGGRVELHFGSTRPEAEIHRGLIAAIQTAAFSEHGAGFSLDADVPIEASDRQGLERLVRYCARPAFALERLWQIDAQHLVYESPKLGPGGASGKF